MDTNPDTAAGTSEASTPSSHTTHGLSVGRHDLRHLLIYKAFIKSGLMEPFRILIKPLKKWVLKHHVAIHTSEGSPDMVDMPLKQPSVLTMVLTALLAPLVFLMLLPLILILVPLALVVGFAALVISTIQMDGTDIIQPRGQTTRQPA